MYGVRLFQDLDINEPEQVVSTLGHMIGHNIGLKHDETSKSQAHIVE